MLLHIATATDWAAALEAGTYRMSTRDQRWEDVGFIHLARPHQVAGVANRFYRGIDDDLVLLIIDAGLVGADIRDEDSYGSGETFPHLYAALPVRAVTATIPYPSRRDGSFGPPDLP